MSHLTQQTGSIDEASPGFIWPGVVYFGCVFGIGFLLGTIRELLIVSVVGARIAELGEIPLMLLAAFFVARWVVNRFRVPPNTGQRILVGLTGLVLLLLAEWSVVQFIRSESITQYIAGRDPLAGSAYLAALVLFALLPWLITLGTHAREGSGPPHGTNGTS